MVKSKQIGEKMAAEIYLTEEFIKFSEAIAKIYQEKKAKHEKFKEVYVEFQNENKKLEDVATIAIKQWEDFVASETAKKKAK